MSTPWHIICRVGEADAFIPDIPDAEPRLLVALGQTGPHAVRHRAFDLIGDLGFGPVPDAIEDVLNFALAVYAADVRVGRIHAEDRWTRNLVLHLPVVDLGRWSEASTIAVRMLSFLTGDHWAISLRSRPAGPQAVMQAGTDAVAKPSCVSLFSGGLDSFAGAIDLLESIDGPVLLVGHYAAGTGHGAQDAAWRIVDRAYPGRTRTLWFYVQPPKGKEGEAEQTMRSRSVLFLGLGLAVANSLGDGAQLFVPENGLISLNVPLTHARAGSLSTRTTHPHFLALFRALLARLGIPTEIRTPYRFCTKGEMLQRSKNTAVLREGAGVTMSCSRPDAGRFQGLTPGRHCGYCIPCLVRRAALFSVGLDDATDYNYDVIADPPKPDTAAGRDCRALQIAIERAAGLNAMQTVAEVLHAGPVPPEEAAEYAAVYRRGLEEVARFFESRENV